MNILLASAYETPLWVVLLASFCPMFFGIFVLAVIVAAGECKRADANEKEIETLKEALKTAEMKISSQDELFDLWNKRIEFSIALLNGEKDDLLDDSE